MVPDDVYVHDMLVLVRWKGRTTAFPLAQFTAVDADESTVEAIVDWHYWIAGLPTTFRRSLNPGVCDKSVSRGGSGLDERSESGT
jgi:hypothetical protein